MILVFLFLTYFILYDRLQVHPYPQVHANDLVLFLLWLSNISTGKYVPIFIHSSVDRHLGCFRVLAIVSSAALNSGVHMSLTPLYIWMKKQELTEFKEMA